MEGQKHTHAPLNGTDTHEHKHEDTHSHTHTHKNPHNKAEESREKHHDGDTEC